MFSPPDEVYINQQPYTTVKGRWQEAPVASQPGDGTRPKPFPWEISSGFGFTNINTNAFGQRPGAAYHNYSENMDVRRPGLYGVSSRITYLAMSPAVPLSGTGGFRLGGYINSQLGAGFATHTVTTVVTQATTLDTVGTVDWGSTPDVVASAPAGGITYYLLAQLAAASRVPAQGVVSAVTATVLRRAQGLAPTVEDEDVRLCLAGAVTGANLAAVGDWATSVEAVSYSLGAVTRAQANGVIGVALAADITDGMAEVVEVSIAITYVVPVAGVGSLGGGQYVETPQFIQEFGETNLYVGCGTRTFRLDMDTDTPYVAEVTNQGASARARSAAVFDNQMMVPLGPAADLVVATDPGSSVALTSWVSAAGVRMNNVAVGAGGRAFTSFINRVYNILPGMDPTVLANYLPSTGEVISDETDPVQSLTEYLRGLVAGTVRGLRTFDPDAGYQGRPLVNPVRMSGTQYDGKSLIMLGDTLLYFTRRVVWLFRAGQRPVRTGPELLDQNEGPWRGMEWGVPDYTGDFIIVPGYRPATGDSVIFTLRERQPDDPGIGPMQWSDWLYLEGKECRVVRFWGGTEDHGPKVVFGAGVEEVGWVGVGLCGAPDLFCTSIKFAEHGTVVGGWDDLGTPGVRKEFDRIEVPVVEHADADNYFQFSISMESEAAFTTLPAVAETGFARILPATADDLIGTTPALKLEVYQEPDQNVALTLKGTVWAYFSEVPDTVQQVTTELETKTTRLFEARQEADRLMALVAGKRAAFRHLPGGETYEGRMISCQAVISEVDAQDQGQRQNTYSLKATWRVVPTSG